MVSDGCHGEHTILRCFVVSRAPVLLRAIMGSTAVDHQLLSPAHRFRTKRHGDGEWSLLNDDVMSMVKLGSNIGLQ